MSATERLRGLLDEHNIEWWSNDGHEPDHTEWVTDSAVFASRMSINGRLAIKTIRVMTPEQAIEETMGRDTCHMMLTELRSGSAYQDIYECSECGEQVVRHTIMGESKPPKYCPECGRIVVE